MLLSSRIIVRSTAVPLVLLASIFLLMVLSFGMASSSRAETQTVHAATVYSHSVSDIDDWSSDQDDGDHLDFDEQGIGLAMAPVLPPPIVMPVVSPLALVRHDAVCAVPIFIVSDHAPDLPSFVRVQKKTVVLLI